MRPVLLLLLAALATGVALLDFAPGARWIQAAALLGPMGGGALAAISGRKPAPAVFAAWMLLLYGFTALPSSLVCTERMGVLGTDVPGYPPGTLVLVTETCALGSHSSTESHLRPVVAGVLLGRPIPYNG